MRENRDKSSRGQDKLSQASVPTILSEKTQITGDVMVLGDLKIGGQVEGNIVVSGKVVVGESAQVIGNIEAKEAYIYGSVKGFISTTGLLSLEKGSQVTGDLKYDVISISQGDKIIGSFAPIKDEEREAFMKRLAALNEKASGLSVVHSGPKKYKESESAMSDIGSW
jgi:cytoskeletal protein CcmA (bactofilin family)